jgi:hypothetical protein
MFHQITRASLSLIAIAAMSSLTGCASIVSGTNQVVSVETLHSGGNVAGASCKLENNKGVYYVTTPGTVTVHRAYGDMNVKCEKPGFDPGLASVKSSTKAMMAGNVVFGGIIGAGVDAASGAAYDYPALFQVMMGQQQTLPAPAPQAQAQAQPQVAVAVAGGTN